MKLWRIILIGVGLILAVVFWGTQVRQAEAVRQEGDILFLKLRPVDPRALMSGDYMALGYDGRAFPKNEDELLPSGKVVLEIDTNRMGVFKRLQDGSALGANEILINYARDREPLYGGARFYFQEGTAKTYDDAAYGIFKVGPDGRAILTALADDQFKTLNPDAKTNPD